MKYFLATLTLIYMVYPCDEGYVEINNLCFFEDDIDIIQKLIDNSYQSGIDLGCEEWDNYCGSPNPYMDDPESWFWKTIDGVSYDFANGNGIVEPLELGIQEWVDGRLKGIMCGAYIYCQLSGQIPEEINYLTEIETFRVEGNYFSGFIPESICDLDINYDNRLEFDIAWNRLCSPYPDCIDTDDQYWGQYDEECSDCSEGYLPDCNGDGDCCPESWVGDGWCDDAELGTACNLTCYEEELADCEECSSTSGDLNLDDQTNIQDVVILVNCILNNSCDDCSDMNDDQIANVLDIIAIINVILG
tara:strand:+ start:49 stop:957 length:909 start_codon:yes stop_codon:yes gene_type:complete